jgi:hypothetical protein
MLISGAVLFSLFQLPPRVDGWLTRWEPHATFEAGFVLLMGYAYLKGALYTLIAAFVVHLAVRAYWVGLVGLNSVFGRGIRWENTQLGPIAQQVYRERMPSLPRLIGRLDNFASVIFSFAFLIVLMSLVSLPIMGLAGAGAYAVSSLVFGGRQLRWVFGAVLLLLIVPPVSVALIDRRYGPRLDPAGAAARRLRRLTRIFYTTQLVGMVGPILYTISTNGRRKTTYALFYLVLLGSVYVVMGEWLVRRGALAMNGADFFTARSNANTVDYAYYESQWAAGVVNDASPSIQADVVREPYVRLFIPYQPPRHNPAVARACPGARPLEPRGTRLARPGAAATVSDSAAARVLRCLAALHAVEVNGTPRPDLRFRFATHPRTGVDGIVAYLPVEGLPRGENLLTVLPPPRRPGSTNPRPLERDMIPFWL